MPEPMHVYIYIDKEDKSQCTFVAMLRNRSSVESSLVRTDNGITPRIHIKMRDGSVKRLYGLYPVRDFFAKYPKY